MLRFRLEGLHDSEHTQDLLELECTLRHDVAGLVQDPWRQSKRALESSWHPASFVCRRYLGAQQHATDQMATSPSGPVRCFAGYVSLGTRVTTSLDIAHTEQFDKIRLLLPFPHHEEHVAVPQVDCMGFTVLKRLLK